MCQYVVRFSDYVPTTASKWTQLLAAGVLEAGRGQSRCKTRASLEAGRGRSGGRTRAVWTQDAGIVDARRGQTGGGGGGKLFLGSTVLTSVSVNMDKRRSDLKRKL